MLNAAAPYALGGFALRCCLGNAVGLRTGCSVAQSVSM